MSSRKDNADQLVQQLRQGLIATQDALEKIIQQQVWKDLGYDTFVELWEDRLGDIEVTGVMRASVVYAMFNDGATEVEVATTVNGVGAKTVASLKQAHVGGLTVKQAEVHARRIQVRLHHRKLPTKRNGIYLDGFTDKELKRWGELAEDLQVDRNEMLRDALREAMNEKVGDYADR